MKAPASCLAAVLVLLAVAPPAAAQKSAGLYEPFPSAASERRAKRFVEALPAGAGDLSRRLRLSDRELKRGVFPAGQRSPSSGPATARVYKDTGLGATAWWWLVLLLAALPAAAAVNRRLTPAAG